MMTDNAASHNEGLWLPTDIWEKIARFLENQDLGKFRQISKITHWVGSHPVILRPLYNRLCALDNTLPAFLPQESTLLAFKQAFEKIQACQQSEITYLTQHHPSLMAKPEYKRVFEKNTAVSLKSLEAKNAVLDKINSEIIRSKINVYGTLLNLQAIRITRLPVTLFHEPAYVHFWQNLTCLDCRYNQLTSLNVQGLAMLQELWCNNNQLTTLKVEGLTALQRLDCNDNQLPALNAQGLTALIGLWCNNNQFTTLKVEELRALKFLDCDNNQLTALNLQGMSALLLLRCHHNPLKDLNLSGVHAYTKNRHAELERSLLFNQLSRSDSFEVRQEIIARLGADFTYKNCLYYCPIYATKLLTADSVKGAYSFVSSAVTRASAFLPSFSFSRDNTPPKNTDHKRKSLEEEIEREFSAGEDGKSPLKKIKKASQE